MQQTPPGAQPSNSPPFSPPPAPPPAPPTCGSYYLNGSIILGNAAVAADQDIVFAAAIAVVLSGSAQPPPFTVACVTIDSVSTVTYSVAGNTRRCTHLRKLAQAAAPSTGVDVLFTAYTNNASAVSALVGQYPVAATFRSALASAGLVVVNSTLTSTGVITPKSGPVAAPGSNAGNGSSSGGGGGSSTNWTLIGGVVGGAVGGGLLLIALGVLVGCFCCRDPDRRRGNKPGAAGASPPLWLNSDANDTRARNIKLAHGIM